MTRRKYTRADVLVGLAIGCGALLCLGLILPLAWGAESHECGHGPVQIEVSLGQCCGCPQQPPTMKRLGENRYESTALITTNAVCCPCDFSHEVWSDWPECGGKLRSTTETAVTWSARRGCTVAGSGGEGKP